MLIASAVTDQIGTINWPQAGSMFQGTISDIATNILQWILVFSGGFAVLAVVYSGFLYITSAGDTAKAETAKKNFTWAIIGVVLISLAYGIVSIVQDVLTNAAPTGTQVTVPGGTQTGPQTGTGTQTQVQSSQARDDEAVRALQAAQQQLVLDTNPASQQQATQIRMIIQQLQNHSMTAQSASAQIQIIIGQIQVSVTINNKQTIIVNLEIAKDTLDKPVDSPASTDSGTSGTYDDSNYGGYTRPDFQEPGTTYPSGTPEEQAPDNFDPNDMYQNGGGKLWPTDLPKIPAGSSYGGTMPINDL